MENTNDYKRLNAGKIINSETHAAFLSDRLKENGQTFKFISEKLFNNTYEVSNMLNASRFDPYFYQLVAICDHLDITMDKIVPFYRPDDGYAAEDGIIAKQRLQRLVDESNRSVNHIAHKVGIYADRLKQFLDTETVYHERISTIIELSRFFDTPTIELMPYGRIKPPEPEISEPVVEAHNDAPENKLSEVEQIVDNSQPTAMNPRDSLIAEAQMLIAAINTPGVRIREEAEIQLNALFKLLYPKNDH